MKCIRAFNNFGGFNLRFKVSLSFIGNETHACRHFDILLAPQTIRSKVYLIDHTSRLSKNHVGCTELGCPIYFIHRDFHELLKS